MVNKLKREVTAFKQGMPAVISLRNHALRSRHWEAVQQLMQKTFIRDKHFTLGVLLNMNVSSGWRRGNELKCGGGGGLNIRAP